MRFRRHVAALGLIAGSITCEAQAEVQSNQFLNCAVVTNLAAQFGRQEEPTLMDVLRDTHYKELANDNEALAWKFVAAGVGEIGLDEAITYYNDTYDIYMAAIKINGTSRSLYSNLPACQASGAPRSFPAKVEKGAALAEKFERCAVFYRDHTGLLQDSQASADDTVTTIEATLKQGARFHAAAATIAGDGVTPENDATPEDGKETLAQCRNLETFFVEPGV